MASAAHGMGLGERGGRGRGDRYRGEVADEMTRFLEPKRAVSHNLRVALYSA